MRVSKRAKRLRIAGKFLFRVQRGACCICGGPMCGARHNRATRQDVYTIEHVRPRSLGGQDEASNIRLSHRRCNCKRGRDLNTFWYPLPCFRPQRLPSLHLVLATTMHSQFRRLAQ